MKQFIKERPVLSYFLFTFVFSWCGVAFFALSTGLPAPIDQFEANWPIAFIPYLFGPAIISLLFVGILQGKAGFRTLGSRFIKWKVPVIWYVFSILMLPFLVSLILYVLSFFSSKFIPDIVTTKDRTALIIQAVAIGFIGGGILEETGWTGFVTPKLRERYGILKSGLILGFFWGLWHFLPVFWGCGNETGRIDWGLFLPGFFFYYSGAIAYRVLMIWVHERTKSIIPVTLMHTSLTASLFFIFNIPQTGISAFVYYLILSIVLWIIVVILSAAGKLKNPE